MSAYGFTAFVDGFFKGRDYRDGREDRKREIERQKRMDELIFQREGRAVERHGLDMESGRVRLDAEKAARDEALRRAEMEEEYRRIMREGMEDPGAEEPLGARPPGSKSGTPDANAAVAGVAANLPTMGAPTRAADAFVRAVPLESLGAKKQTQAGGAGADSLAGGSGADGLTDGALPLGYTSRAGAMADARMGGPSRVMYDDARRRQAERMAAMQGPMPAVRTDIFPPDPAATVGVNPSYTENRPDRFPPEPVSGARGEGYPLTELTTPPPDRRMNFEPEGYPLNTWQAPPRVEVQEATRATLPPAAAPAARVADPAPRQLDRRAQFEPPVDPNRPSELVTFSPEQIRRSAQPAPGAGPSLGARVRDALKPGLDTWAGAMQPNYDHQFGQPGGLVGDASEVILRAPRVAGAVVTGVNEAVDEGVIRPAIGAAANAANRAVNPMLRYAAGVEAPLVEGAPFGPGSMIDRITGAPTAPAPDAPPAAGRPPAAAAPTSARPAPPPAAAAPATTEPVQPMGARKAAPAPQANPIAPQGRLGPTVEAAKEAQVARAAQAVGPAAAVAVDEAQKVSKAPLGAADTKPMTPKQRDRAATSAMERYTTVVVPRLIEAMVKNGDIDRAMKFQDFMDAAETRRAMKDYVHMVVAAGEQDIETFAKHFIAAYNRLGYYNDGTTIVPEQSRFTTDETGAVNGAVITFRNEETGDTYERVYDDPNQLYMVGLAAADPLNAFTETAARIKSANDAALGAKKAARDEVREAAKERQKNIQEAAKLIFEQASKNVLPGQAPPITYQEALEEARQAFPDPAEQAAPPAAPPPLLRRP